MTNTLPHAVDFTKIDIDAWMREMLGRVVGQRCSSDDIEPAIIIDINEFDIAVIGWRQEALIARHI